VAPGAAPVMGAPHQGQGKVAELMMGGSIAQCAASGYGHRALHSAPAALRTPTRSPQVPSSRSI